jgi:hypothetical protein
MAADDTAPNDTVDGDLVDASAAAPTRRCWRCLQTFACEAADVGPGPAGWWVCDPCHGRLLDTAPARTG